MANVSVYNMEGNEVGTWNSTMQCSVRKSTSIWFIWLLLVSLQIIVRVLRKQKHVLK